MKTSARENWQAAQVGGVGVGPSGELSLSTEVPKAGCMGGSGIIGDAARASGTRREGNWANGSWGQTVAVARPPGYCFARLPVKYL